MLNVTFSKKKYHILRYVNKVIRHEGSTKHELVNKLELL